MRVIAAFALATASITSPVAAQTERDLDSHEHGAAALNIAIENGSVFIELDTPWNNLVGFEHAPGNDEQHALVDEALTRLNAPEQLFSFVGADCAAQQTSLENNLGTADDEHHDDEHHDDKDSDEDHDHKDDHAAEGHDEHDDEHKHDEHAEDEHHDDEYHAETHSSVLAMFSFNCNNLDALSAIDVRIMEIWSGFESLSVQLIGSGGQTSVALNPQQTTVDVTKVQ